MKVEADARRVHILFLLIPTKETVFSNAVESRIGLDKNYRELVRMENDARSAIISDCASTGIEYADALPALTDALSRGQQVYPPNADSHPNPKGYAVIANVVKNRLEQLNW